jgi:hypothetical protein
MIEKLCPWCANTGWVCEEHPDRSWPHKGCDGAAMPCPVCNVSNGLHDPPNVSGLGFKRIMFSAERAKKKFGLH